MDSVPLISENQFRNRSKLSSFFLAYRKFTSRWEKLLLCITILTAIANGCIQPLMSYVFGHVTQVLIDITSAISNSTIEPADLEKAYTTFENEMNMVIFEFFLCGFSYFVLWSLQVSIIRYIGENFTYRIRKEYINRLIRSDASYFDSTSTGALSSILNDNFERFREGMNDKCIQIVALSMDYLFGIIVGFLIDWKLSIIGFTLSLGIALSGLINSYSISRNTEKQNLHYSNAGSFAFQALGSYKTVISLNGQIKEIEQYTKQLKMGEKYGISRAFFYGLTRAVQYFFCNALNCVLLYIGTDMIYNHVLPAQSVVQLFHCFLFGAFAFSDVFPFVSLLTVSISSVYPITEFLFNNENEIEQNDEQDILEDENQFEGNVKFENVRFSYPTRPSDDVLKGVDLEIKSGECIGLVGASGCGKSTIVQLLLRYYNINAGKILIDNHNIESLNLKTLRKSIGVVSQEPVLFNATIEENLRFGNESTSLSQMYEALKKANAYNFVTGFPNGIHTVVGERGAQLSGGQKQRIAIARALLRNPKVLLLDEATSALDNESERIVQKALEKASEGRTTLVIAHRLSTIRNAHKIVVMKKGEIIEVGKHEELLAKNGVYYDLIQAQLLDSKDENDDENPSLSRQTSHELEPASNLQTFSNDQCLPHEDDLQRLVAELAEEGAEKANLFRILKHCRADAFIIFLAFFVSAIQGFYYPLLSQLIAENYSAYALNGADLLKYGHLCALLYMALGVGRSITVFIQYYLFGKASEQLSTRLRLKSYKHLLSLPCSFYDDPRHSPTRLTTRLNTDASNVKAALEARIGNLIMTFVSFLTAVTLAMYYNWQMTVFVLLMCPILYFAEYLFDKSISIGVQEEVLAFENSNKIAIEGIEHVRTVRALNMENKIMSLIMSPMDRVKNRNFKKSIIHGIGTGVAFSTFLFVYAASFKFGVWLVKRNQIDPMDIYRILMFIAMTATTAGSAVTYFPDYKKAIYAAGLIFKIFTYPATVDISKNDGKKDPIKGGIDGEDLHFHYSQRPDHLVLKGVNLRIEPKKTIALVGPSGCGKSTIISLLERYYTAFQGEMKIDGINIENINLPHLRSNIALVSQEPTLFNCSIHDNLIYGLTRPVSPLEIEQSLQTANAYNFVFSFPQGLETIVGERGAQLSGGQKQRLAIARAILRNPNILLLDEATSALDTDSEKVVQNALDNASQQLTTVIVAHRISTVVEANSIAVLKDGKVAEQGTHEQLLRNRNIYWRLVTQGTIKS